MGQLILWLFIIFLLVMITIAILLNRKIKMLNRKVDQLSKSGIEGNGQLEEKIDHKINKLDLKVGQLSKSMTEELNTLKFETKEEREYREKLEAEHRVKLKELEAQRLAKEKEEEEHRREEEERRGKERESAATQGVYEAEDTTPRTDSDDEYECVQRCSSEDTGCNWK